MRIAFPRIVPSLGITRLIYRIGIVRYRHKEPKTMLRKQNNTKEMVLLHE